MTDQTEMQARIEALEAENGRMRAERSRLRAERNRYARACVWVRTHGHEASRGDILRAVKDALSPNAALKGEGE